MKPFAMPGKSQFLYVWVNCWDSIKRTIVRRQRSTRTTNRKDAEKEGFRLQAIEDEKQKASQSAQRTIRQICKDYVNNRVGINPESTILNYTNCLDIFLEALGDYADRPKLDADAPPRVLQFLYLHYSGNTIEDRGRFCKRLLRHVIKVTGGELWWLDDFKVDSQSDGDESQREIFNNDQTVALRDACETDEERAFLRFAENLGGRISDMIRLVASNLNPKSGNFRYLNTKTGKICGAWLWPENQAYVRSVIENSKEKDPVLFPSFNHNERRDVQAACAWFAKILTTARIRSDADLIETKPGLTKVVPLNKARNRRNRYHHSFHSYRVRLITILASIGVPLHIIMEIVGHEDPRTTRRYIRTLEDDVISASKLLGNQSIGAWQELADKSMKDYPDMEKITKEHQLVVEFLPPQSLSPDESPRNHAPIDNASIHPVTPPNISTATLVITGATTTTSGTNDLRGPAVPNQQKKETSGGVLSANSMKKDTLMLSSVPKGWPGLKPK